MNMRFAKLLVLGVALVAFSLQGFARAGAIVCDTGHAHISDASVHSEPHSSEHLTAHELSLDEASHSPEQAEPDVNVGAKEALGSTAKFKCNAGAPCCTGAALPGAELAVPAQPNGGHVFPPAQTMLISADPDSFERPPRISRA